MSDDSLIYPLTFTPVFKDYPWGGRNLETIVGRSIPDGIVAESWDIADHPNGSSPIANGPLAGKTLAEAMQILGVDLVGSRSRDALERGRFPLLIKLLDANQWLSVQVHPDDEYSLQNEGELGKTEMWVVLHAEPGSKLAFGFKQGVTPEAFEDAARGGDCAEHIHLVPVSVGDVIFVPTGAVHALGPGIIIAEIQQNSDVTYRLYDWGRPRPIHIEQAMDVLDFELVEPGALEPKVLADNGVRVERIGDCRHFRTDRLTFRQEQPVAGVCDGQTFEIWGVLEGSATLEWRGEPMTIQQVGWVLLPAALGEYRITAPAGSVLLRVSVP